MIASMPLTPFAVISIVAASTWSSWFWYAQRISATPEEGLALLLTALLVTGTGLAKHARQETLPLGPIAALLALYALTTVTLPPIFPAAFSAVLVLGLLYRVLHGASPPVAFYGLVALSLPVVPSLQFVLGYPMRLVSASATVALLELQGLAVAREGTYLVWAGERIQFDAPCSGVNMLWAGLTLTLMACTLWRSRLAMTAIALLLTVISTIAANVLRATSLFYVEAGVFKISAPGLHEGIGIIAFVISALAMLFVLQRLRTWEMRS